MDPITPVASLSKAQSSTGKAEHSLIASDTPLAPQLSGHIPKLVFPTQKPIRATVLSVDDNDDLRRVMEFTLGVLGFNVISCPDAESASRAYRASAGIDMLITDLEMPGRSGIELAHELCSLSPSMPVLIVSGAYFSQEIQHAVEKGNWRFLAKPYAMPEFFANICDLLRLSSVRAKSIAAHRQSDTALSGSPHNDAPTHSTPRL